MGLRPIRSVSKATLDRGQCDTCPVINDRVGVLPICPTANDDHVVWGIGIPDVNPTHLCLTGNSCVLIFVNIVRVTHVYAVHCESDMGWRGWGSGWRGVVSCCQ